MFSEKATIVALYLQFSGIDLENYAPKNLEALIFTSGIVKTSLL